jgi:hypothetical protein
MKRLLNSPKKKKKSMVNLDFQWDYTTKPTGPDMDTKTQEHAKDASHHTHMAIEPLHGHITCQAI